MPALSTEPPPSPTEPIPRSKEKEQHTERFLLAGCILHGIYVTRFSCCAMDRLRSNAAHVCYGLLVFANLDHVRTHDVVSKRKNERFIERMKPIKINSVGGTSFLMGESTLFWEDSTSPSHFISFFLRGLLRPGRIPSVSVHIQQFTEYPSIGTQQVPCHR